MLRVSELRQKLLSFFVFLNIAQLSGYLLLLRATIAYQSLYVFIWSFLLRFLLVLWIQRLSLFALILILISTEYAFFVLSIRSYAVFGRKSPVNLIDYICTIAKIAAFVRHFRQVNHSAHSSVYLTVNFFFNRLHFIWDAKFCTLSLSGRMNEDWLCWVRGVFVCELRCTYFIGRHQFLIMSLVWLWHRLGGVVYKLNFVGEDFIDAMH